MVQRKRPSEGNGRAPAGGEFAVSVRGDRGRDEQGNDATGLSEKKYLNLFKKVS